MNKASKAPDYTIRDLEWLCARMGKDKSSVPYREIARLYNFSLDLIKRRNLTAEDEKRAFVANCLSAWGGCPDAVLAQGWFYVNGIGTEFDLLAAKQCYFRAAETKDSRAFFSLGEINEMQGNEAWARDWYRKAAKEGDSDAALRLARLILEKARTKRQIASALKWLNVAESLGSGRAKRFAKSKKVSAARRRLDSSI